MKVTAVRKMFVPLAKFKVLIRHRTETLFFLFFGHLSVIDRIFLAETEFFFGHNDRKKFVIIVV